jgi:hypothetical protein
MSLAEELLADLEDDDDDVEEELPEQRDDDADITDEPMDTREPAGIDICIPVQSINNQSINPYLQFPTSSTCT